MIRERNRALSVVKESESALRGSYARIRELAGNLIIAQETERARIARIRRTRNAPSVASAQLVK